MPFPNIEMASFLRCRDDRLQLIVTKDIRYYSVSQFLVTMLKVLCFPGQLLNLHC